MSLIFTKNIRQLINDEDMTISDFAEAIGEKTSRVNDVLSEKQRPPFDMLEKILANFDVDANWLISGTENREKKNISRVDAVNDEYGYVPVYDVAAAAGSGAASYGVSAPVTHLAFRKDWLKLRGLYEKDLNIITAKGDSMEPTINSQDTLLVDTSKSTPRDGQIYVIRSADILWVKRIQQQIDGSLLLISDNAAYPPMPLNLKDHPDIEVIGQVVNVSKDLN